MAPLPANVDPVKSAVLLAPLDTLDPPRHLERAIAAAAGATLEHLVIVFVSPLFNGSNTDAPSGSGAAYLARREDDKARAGIAHAANWHAVQRLLTFAYVAATRTTQAHGRVLQDVDVLLRGVDEGLPGDLRGEVVYLIEGVDLSVTIPHTLSSARTVYLQADASTPAESAPTQPANIVVNETEPSVFPVVALGGTFDHLHAGHKILLSMAAFLASRKLIIGMTDDALLKNKSNKHVLEDLATRSAHVRAFVDFVRPGLVLDVVAIVDVAGPTGWDADIQALVVSRETRSGADAIHKIRAEKGLPPLRTFVIDVISATEASIPEDVDGAALREAKMSSTFIRQWIADRLAAGEGSGG